jgi:hypothetical protein
VNAPHRSWLAGLRALVARDVGTLHVHVHGEHGVEPRTIILTPGQVRRLRWLLSPLGLALAGVFAVSWVALAAVAARVPGAATRIAELETEAAQLDTLELRLQDLQLRYDQVTRMLGAAPAPADSTPPDGDDSTRRQ